MAKELNTKNAVAATAALKPAKKNVAEKETTIKYSDKSAGQPELVNIFKELCVMMQPYEKGSIKKSGGDGGKIMLVSKKEINVDGRKKDEVWFVSALIQKGFVGLYYMPVYGRPEIKKYMKPELLKCLKGKACFHIKKLDDTLRVQIKEVLEIGYECYKKMGWV